MACTEGGKYVGVRITVWVKPGARRETDLISPPDGEQDWILFTPAKPVDGEANRALIEAIANHFNIRKTDVAIKSGLRSRRKIVEIRI